MATGAGLAASGYGTARAAADGEAEVMKGTSGERETGAPTGALSRPHRLNPSRLASHSGACDDLLTASSSEVGRATLHSLIQYMAGGGLSDRGRARLTERGQGETDMKGSAIGMVAAGCLVVGFGAGFVARPMISPGGSSAAAVRRHRLFSGTSLANATLKLGDCSPGGVGPGVTCMTQLTMDPTGAGATPQNRPVGFARVNGQWEVAIW